MRIQGIDLNRHANWSASSVSLRLMQSWKASNAAYIGSSGLMRFHKPFAYTPSKYWAARIDMKHIAARGEDKTNKQAYRRDKGKAKDPMGVEVVEPLHGAVQVDAYGKQSAVLLRMDPSKALNLEIVELP